LGHTRASTQAIAAASFWRTLADKIELAMTPVSLM
jgi:hypothetical protein